MNCNVITVQNNLLLKRGLWSPQSTVSKNQLESISNVSDQLVGMLFRS